MATLRWVASTVWRADGRRGNRSVQQRWRGGSAALQKRVLSAIAPQLRPSVQLRNGLADPRPNIAESRSALVPATFWAAWAIRLTPPDSMDPTFFRAILSALILLPGSHITRAEAVAVFGDQLKPGALSHALARLRQAETGDRVLTAITHLATALDDHSSAIDYARRRHLLARGVPLDAERLSATCRRYGTLPTKGLRRHVERYIHELLTGSEPSFAPGPYQAAPGHQRVEWRRARHRFPAYIRTFCHDEAESILRDAGIAEPLRWEPPTSWVPDINWPGREPDDIGVARLACLIEDGATEAYAAAQLGVTREHIRYTVDRHKIPTNTPPSLKTTDALKKRHLVALEGPLEPARLRVLYEDQGHTTREIAELAGCSRQVVTRAARDAGIPMRPVGSPPKALRIARSQRAARP